MKPKNIVETTHSVSDLCRIIGQLEGHIINLNQSLLDLKNALDAIQTRVLVVEKQHSFIRGCIGVLLTLGAVVGVALDHMLKWVFWR